MPACHRKLYSFALISLCALSVHLFAAPSIDDQWRQFRDQHPFHIQVVALSGPDENQHRLLLITEPPPHATLAEIQQLAPQALNHPMVKQQAIGYDGWVKDIAFDLPALSEPDLRLLIDRVHQYLFGTSYKAAALPLTANPPSSASSTGYKLDLHVPAHTLGTWLLQQESTASGSKRSSGLIGGIVLGLVLLFLALVMAPRRARKPILVFAALLAVGTYLVVSRLGHSSNGFMAIEGGPAKDLRSILQNGYSGVFVSEKPGLVVWSVPRGEPLSNYAIEARQFALDSDLVLGAIAGPKQVAIVARERVAPVDLLPPLRTETILLLASANTEELAQSYERNNLLAGKYDKEKNLDWAPVYLSPQLINTEYGSLLNITDQLLKSWSQSGEIEYANFHYPNRKNFPFTEPLSRHAHTDEVTFNWNTKGMGYFLTEDQFEIFGLNRTGALGVDYLAGDKKEMQEAENDAYDYFNREQDPNLVRVVQYAALYQIFRHFGITAPAPATVPLRTSDTLKLAALTMVAAIERIDDSKLAMVMASLQEKMNSHPESAEDIQRAIDHLGKLHEDRVLLTDFARNRGGEGLRLLVENIASPRDPDLQPPPEIIAKLQAAGSDQEREDILNAMSSHDQMRYEASIIAERLSEHRMLLQLIASPPLDMIMRGYAAEMGSTENTWIRTPSIVISHATSELAEEGVVGGHNLDAAISPFRHSDEVPAGSIKVIDENGQRVVLYNPRDSGRVGELVRDFGKADEKKSPDEVASALSDKLKSLHEPPNVSADIALFTPKLKPDPSRGLSENMSPTAVPQTGFRSGAAPNREQNALSEFIASNTHSAIVVDRDDSGKFLVIQNNTRRIFEAGDVASAQDAVLFCMRQAARDKTPVRLHLRGFEPEQGYGFAESTDLKLSSERPPEITTLLDESKMSTAELKDILNRNYDFQNARVEDLRIVATDADGTHLEASVVVPEKSASKGPLRLLVKILSKFGLTEERLAAVRTRISQFTASLADTVNSMNFLSASATLRRDLKGIVPSAQVRVKVSREAKDLYIVHVRPLALEKERCIPA
ncbi:MAG TPA: hypothetical protein VJW20_01915 [Candidatus Angelobacter sp.]|nr:hypothetical protein [Candidatus Angelobacter sp.]